jgi:demethylmenaquinone methyltransferase/2-methoxy-6-polyprenyl-1,4-benzoquinol methylase
MNGENKKNQVKRIFDSISARYDFLNHFFSAGIDYYWRKKALKLTGISSESKLLDVACGTGDVAIEAMKNHGVKKIVGADLSLNMLKLFETKAPAVKGKTVQCVAENLPFKNEAFTNITVAFGVRNFYDIKESFKSFKRVLSEKGKVTVIEFRMPRNKIIKKLFDFYFAKVITKVGRAVSKDPQAYDYFQESVHEFDRTINLPALFKEAGFSHVEYYSLTLGIVQVVIAEK